MASKEALTEATGRRTSTITSRHLAVERVILAMHERLHETFYLEDMAEIAFLSPCHFNRVFRWVTGIPPREFLSALRLETAKQLLLTTRKSITDVCFDVGYNSLGTFTKRFTQFVGLSPTDLRRLTGQAIPSSPEWLRDLRTEQASVISSGADVTGYINAPDTFEGFIFVGLFTTHIPQSQPVGCALLTQGGRYHIGSVPDGCYYLFATAFTRLEDPLAYLLASTWLRGSANRRPLLVRNGRVSGHRNVTLRPAQLTDPPILVALPFLLNKRMASDTLVPFEPLSRVAAAEPALSSGSFSLVKQKATSSVSSRW